MDVGPPEDELWSLGAHPGSLYACAAAWRDLADGTAAAGAAVEAEARVMLAEWQGGSAEAYRTHQAQLVDALRAVAVAASSVSGVMEDAGGVVGAAQTHLDDAYRRRDVNAALDIRAHADGRLAELAVTMDGLRGQVWPAAPSLLGAAPSLLGAAPSLLGAAPWPGGPPPPYDGLAELAAAGAVFVDGDRVVVNATGGDDHIRVSVDPRTGEQLVTVGGVLRRFPAGADVIVRAGAGDDTITVAPGSTARVTLLGGVGDDRMHGAGGDETMLGLWGRDYLDGQGGRDRLDGGDGADTLYGLDGDDTLTGGPDRDYLDGGAGADRIGGGGAADVLMGGRGADVLHGGAGGSAGSSGLGGPGGFGGDALYSGADTGRPDAARVGGFIRIDGSAEFVARVESDLDALRSSPRGSAMLAALDGAHTDSGLFQTTNGLVIRETDAANGFARAPLLGLGDAVIEYNAFYDDLPLSPPVPPVVVLYHELAHVYDYFHDTLAWGTYEGADNPGVPAAERVAVGLPIDHDGDPRTPDVHQPDHPFELTENGLRAEFGLTARQRY